jgi:hypothetical protein
MFRHFVTAVVVVGAMLGVAAQSELPPPFPRTNATKLLETDRIVVWNIVWPKGQPTAMHRHIYDQVGTYYARGGRTITTPDGAGRQTMTEVGSLSTTRKGTTHIEEGNTDPPLRAVFIELKRDTPSGLGAPAGDAIGFSRAGAKTALDDDRVRVLDYTSATGADTSAVAMSDTVIVYLGEGRLRIARGGGKAEEQTVAPGAMRYIARGTRERETVLAGTPRALAFEIK